MQSRVAEEKDLESRLFIFGVLFGMAILLPVGFLVKQQHRLLLSNVTMLEELRWIRQHPGTDPPSTRTSAGWKGYAPYDKGSSLRNYIAFWKGDRHPRADGKAS